MKKTTKELMGKTVKELEKQATALREDIAKTILNQKVNPSKDTNLLRKKRKQLAVILTVITQKGEQEKTV
jgi:ribosomal protein L29